jgi:hypothetical protein
MRCISSTRLACKDKPDVLEMLGLDMAIQRPFGIWKAQGDRYYKNILASEEVLAEVAKYNVPHELLVEGEKELKKAVETHDRKKSAKAEAEHATHLKNEMYKDLVEWMKDFYRIVEMAFKKNPQLKEKVNIVVPYLK